MKKEKILGQEEKGERLILSKFRDAKHLLEPPKPLNFPKVPVAHSLLGS